MMEKKFVMTQSVKLCIIPKSDKILTNDFLSKVVESFKLIPESAQIAIFQEKIFEKNIKKFLDGINRD